MRHILKKEAINSTHWELYGDVSDQDPLDPKQRIAILTGIGPGSHADTPLAILITTCEEDGPSGIVAVAANVYLSSRPNPIFTEFVDSPNTSWQPQVTQTQGTSFSPRRVDSSMSQPVALESTAIQQQPSDAFGNDAGAQHQHSFIPEPWQPLNTRHINPPPLPAALSMALSSNQIDSMPTIPSTAAIEALLAPQRINLTELMPSSNLTDLTRVSSVTSAVSSTASTKSTCKTPLSKVFVVF